jgi:hypothetical protein
MTPRCAPPVNLHPLAIRPTRCVVVLPRRVPPEPKRLRADRPAVLRMDRFETAEKRSRPGLQPQLAQTRQDARDPQEVVVVRRQPVRRSLAEV